VRRAGAKCHEGQDGRERPSEAMDGRERPAIHGVAGKCSCISGIPAIHGVAGKCSCIFGIPAIHGRKKRAVSLRLLNGRK